MADDKNRKNKKILKELDNLSFESLLSKLEENTEILSSQKISLEQMMKLYEESEVIKNKCIEILEKMTIKFEHITSQK